VVSKKHKKANTMQQEQIIDKLNNIESLILDGSEYPYTFQQACRYLSLKPSYLYKLTSLKKIPFYKPSGKKLYFKRKDLDKWIYGNYGEKKSNPPNPQK
jgi:excisionase family DNA binding protein